MHLVKLESRPKEWDELIRAFSSKTLFHESAWHDHILSIHKKCYMLYFSINENEKTIGYFCGLVVQKLFLKIMGSPLSGTGTNYMGPVVNPGINHQKLIAAIDAMCKKEGIAYIELCNDILHSDIMEQNGYKIKTGVTHKLKIPNTIESAFSSLKSTGRNRIRKSQKNSLKVEFVNDASIVDEFYDQYKEVYGKQGKATPFGIDRVLSIFHCLQPVNRLLPICIKKDEQVIATGLFPFDENAIYFWGAASYLKYHKYCPNELLHWEVIKYAVNKRIRVYNMCGGGSRFKNKFGGDDVQHVKYFKSTSAIVLFLRSAYRYWHFFKINLSANFFTKKKKRIG